MARREPTPAQREYTNREARGHPPITEQHPLSEAEQRLLDTAATSPLHTNTRQEQS
jgi:hypothetical protein